MKKVTEADGGAERARRDFKAMIQAQRDAEAAKARAREAERATARHQKVLDNGPPLRDGEEDNPKMMWFRENLEWEPHPELWCPPSTGYSDGSGSFVERSNAKWFTENMGEIFSQVGGGYGTVWTGITDEDRWVITDEQFEQLKDVVEGLEGYPIIDEQLYSEMEYDAYNEYYQDEGRKELRQALLQRFSGDPEAQMAVRFSSVDAFDHLAWNSDISQAFETETGGGVYFRANAAAEGFNRDEVVDLVSEEEARTAMASAWAERIQPGWIDTLAEVRRDDERLVNTVAELEPSSGFNLFTKLMVKVGADWEWDQREDEARDAFDIDSDSMKEMAQALEPGMLSGLRPEDPRQLRLAIEQILNGEPTFTLFEGFKEKKQLFVSQGASPEEVDALLTQFKRLKQRGLLQGEEADIDRYTDLDSLRQAVEAASQKQSKTGRKREVRHKEAIVLRDDEEMQIVVPKTWAAAKAYGKGTKWCISMKEYPSHWTEYHKKLAKHYMIWNKRLPAPTMGTHGEPIGGSPLYKIAVTIYPDGHSSIYNAQDQAITEQDLKRATGFSLSDFKSWEEHELAGRDLFRLMGAKNVPFRERVERIGAEGWAEMGKNVAMRELWSSDQAEDLKGKSKEEVDAAWDEFWQKARQELLDYPDDEDYEKSLKFYVESLRLPPGKQLALLEDADE